MTVRRLLGLAAAGLLALAPAGCKDATNDGAPTPGWVPVRLLSPTPGDGGVVFTLAGGTVDSMRSTFAIRHFRQVSGTSWRVLIGGTIVDGGVIAEIHVPDTRNPGSHTGTVEQVADAVTYEQRPTTGYTITVGTAATP